MTQVVFRDRDFGDQSAQPDLDFNVKRYSWNVIGGPKQARIEAIGPDVDLWRLIEMIRKPVWLYSKYSEAVWWGYVAEVRLVVRSEASIRDPSISQRLKIGISVEKFYNSIPIKWPSFSC